MSKSDNQKDELHLALYLLKQRFNTPIDLIKYWAFAGSCQEPHPDIENCKYKLSMAVMRNILDGIFPV